MCVCGGGGGGGSSGGGQGLRRGLTGEKHNRWIKNRDRYDIYGVYMRTGRGPE